MSEPHISIVLCTLDRADLLRQALASLTALKTDGLFTCEIVVVDNGSTDNTQQVVAHAAAMAKRDGGPLIRSVPCHEPGIVAARNCGIAQARGDWIAFFDDDQLAEPDWLLELWRGAQRYACPVVGGTVLLALPDDAPQPLDPVVRMLLGEALHGPDPRPYGGRLTPGCGNLMVARHVFTQIGTFQRTIDGRGEDTDLFSRIERAHIPAWYIPTAVVWHLTPPPRLTDDYLLGLARRMGRGVAQRQAAVLGQPRLALLTLGKTLRLALVQLPAMLLARPLGTHQQWLGRRCLVAINTHFLLAALKELCRLAPLPSICAPPPAPPSTSADALLLDATLAAPAAVLPLDPGNVPHNRRCCEVATASAAFLPYPDSPSATIPFHSSSGT